MQELERLPTTLPGCYELIPRIVRDARGTFVKTFHRDAFAAQGLVTTWCEQYYSVSRRGVLRGLHFQAPPHDHEKLVFCSAGRVLDAVLDLRVDSPAYGQHFSVELCSEKANMLYIPRGLAHGFCVTSASATLHYLVASVYAPTHDQGVLWNSAGIAWPIEEPELSPRDRAFPAFKDFASPF